MQSVLVKYLNTIRKYDKNTAYKQIKLDSLWLQIKLDSLWLKINNLVKKHAEISYKLRPFIVGETAVSVSVKVMGSKELELMA